MKKYLLFLILFSFSFFSNGQKPDTSRSCMYFGMFHNPFVPDSSLQSLADRESKIDSIEGQLGRKLDIDHNYIPWRHQDYTGTPIPPWKRDLNFARWDLANGRIPMINLNRYFSDSIALGYYDQDIKNAADSIKSLNGPVFITFNHEFHLAKWAAITQDSFAFISAWRRMFTIFQNRGATNAAWFWCTLSEPFIQGGTSRDTVMSYYPGDAYVDWIAADGYNHRADSIGRSFVQTFRPWYYYFRTHKPNKPLIISEFGTADDYRADSLPGYQFRENWFNEARDSLKANFPAVRGIVYWNAPGDINDSIWVNYPVQNTVTGFNAFKAMGLDSMFNCYQNIAKIDDLMYTQKLMLFPNPAADEVEIQFNSSKNIGLSDIVFNDLLGKETLRYHSPNAENNIRINITSLSKGIYIVSGRFSNGNIHKTKLVVLK